MNAFADALERVAADQPDQPALRFGGQVYSRSQLARRTRRAAANLWHRLGVRPGDRVAWLGLNHADQIVALFALARIGAMLVPLNTRLATAEWAAVLADCTPLGLLHDGALAAPAAALAGAAGLPAWPGERLFDGAPRHERAPDAPDHARGDAPVLLVYTSGTTGTPKGAVHTQANLAANMAIAAQVQAITGRDHVLTVLPLFHVGGLCIQTLPALGAGAQVTLLERFDAQATLQAVATLRPSLTLQVPATLRALIEHPLWPQTDLSVLRAVWAGSSVLPQALVDAVHARGVPLCNVYGATETGPFSIALGPDEAMAQAGSCGRPAPGVSARLMPAGARATDHAPAAGGDTGAGEAEGEVWLRGPNIVARYWPDRDALDAQGWFHTGDLARRDAQGRYTIVGRAKDMIISGGENIYPAEIENLLATHAWVAECAVFGRPDTTWGEVPVAAVVLREGAPDDWAAQLGTWLNGRIARYKQPRAWMRLAELPKTALGKVRKDALRDAG